MSEDPSSYAAKVVVIAVGAAIPMPAILNPKNMAEYKAEREKEEKKKPEFTTVKWSKTSAKEGDEIELTAQVKDIDDGNAVTFQIWKDGQDVASGIAQKVVSASIDGGVAKAVWQYRTFGTDVPPSSDPKFFFSAHSAWCPFKKSGSATVELKRPELSSPEWKDEETGSSSKGLVGKPLKLSVNCNSDTEEGAGVVFRIYNEGAIPDTDQPIAEIGSENKGGKAEAEWTYIPKRNSFKKQENPMISYYRDVLGLEIDPTLVRPYIVDYKENTRSEKITNAKFVFYSSAKRAQQQKSGTIEVTDTLTIQMVNSFGNPVKDIEYIFIAPDGSELKKKSDSDGNVVIEDALPGQYTSKFEIKKDK